MYHLHSGRSVRALLLCAVLIGYTRTLSKHGIDAVQAAAEWQLLKPNQALSGGRIAGFTPYPGFINGQTPRQPAVQWHCSSTNACHDADTFGASSQQTVEPSSTNAIQQSGFSTAPPHASFPTASTIQHQHAVADPPSEHIPPSLQQQQQLHASPHTAEEAAIKAPNEATQAAPNVANAPAGTTSATQTPASPVAATAPLAAPAPASVGPLPPADASRPQAAPSPAAGRRLLNLAELGDGASVLAANPEAKKPERAIDKDIDSFMKNDCHAQKWMIIELSQLGTVESVKLTMKELYSSRVHTFRVFGRTTHPRKDGPDYTHSLGSSAWQLLGSFTAENRRGTQSFSLPQRSRVRYLLMMFDTHYGNEVMCAMNALEVLGMSAAQELEEALALQEAEGDAEDGDTEPENEQVPQTQQQQDIEQFESRQQQQQHEHFDQQQQQQQERQQGSGVVPGGDGFVIALPSAAEPAPSTAGAHQGTQQLGQGAAEQQQAPQHSGQQVEQPLDSHSYAQPGSELKLEVERQLQQQDNAAGNNQQQQEPQTQQLSSAAAVVANGGLATGDTPVAAGNSTDHAQHSVQSGMTAEAEQHQMQQQVGDAAQQVSPVKQQQQQQQHSASPIASGVVQAQPAGRDGSVSSSVPAGASSSSPELPVVPAPLAGPGSNSSTSSNGTQQQLPDDLQVGTPKTPHLQQQQQQQLHPQPTSGASTSTSSSAKLVNMQEVVAGSPGGTLDSASKADPEAPNAAAAATAGLAPADPGPVAGSTSGSAHSSGGSTGGAGNASSGAAGGDGTLGSHQALSGSNAGQQQQQQMASHGNGAQQQQQQQSGSNIPQQSQQQQGKQQQQQRETGSVLDSRGSTKPKQAGNLFDVIKSEMLQLKLDQGKVAKRLDSLGKRSTDVEALAALLQQQQAHFQAQLEGLSARLDALATAHAQAELRRELQQSSHAAAGSTGGPGAGAAGSAFGSVHQHHPQGTVNPDEFDVMGNEPAVRSQLCPKPVAASGMAPSGVLPLLYQPLYQWSVVAALAVTAPLGLPFLLQSNNSSFPKGARLLVCCLAVVNGLLAVVLSVWLVVLRVGWAVPALVSDLAPQQLVVIPVHRMLGAGSP